MVQKNRHAASAKRRFLIGAATTVSIMSMLWCGSFVSLADATGKVNVGSAKIRQSTDTASEVVGSTSQGKTVTIKSQVTDAAGVSWYEVYIDLNTTGYIRADLVDKNDDGEIQQLTAGATETPSDAGQSDGTQTDAGAAASGGGTGATVQAENPMDAQYAALTVNSNVRATPSKDSDAVTKLNEGTQVIVSGQSNGSDGKTWYFVTFTGADGGEKTGFIRSDLLSLGEMVPLPAEPEVPVEQEVPVEPEIPVNNDYELVYKDAEGEWYLVDHTSGGEFSYEHKLSELLGAAQNQSEAASEDAKTLVKQRIAIVVLVVLAVALVIAVIIMAVKLRDAYYEDYEDDEDEDEDDEEEEEETPVRRRRRTEEEEEEAPVRRRRRTEEEEEEAPVRRRRRTEEEEEEAPTRRRRRTVEEETPAKRRRRMEEEEAEKEKEKAAAAKRKSKNFLLDDDEFEFEFLNMDDKK
ncbi:MAG: SH3 domain-containing protein [Lachnospiraceae bacterium]|nr:SH3 domain-containing protein [Lachnospiraceae bacterium]